MRQLCYGQGAPLRRCAAILDIRNLRMIKPCGGLTVLRTPPYRPLFGFSWLAKTNLRVHNTAAPVCQAVFRESGISHLSSPAPFLPLFSPVFPPQPAVQNETSGPVCGRPRCFVFDVYSSSLRTARNASVGIWTVPKERIFFLPSFCFSSSFFLRVMSPP